MFDIRKETNNTIELANKILSEVYSNYNTPTIKEIVYTKARSYWAMCKCLGGNKYQLRISDIFELIPDENIARCRFTSTIIHELIHTISGCMNHGRRFHLICNLVNCKYPQYKLQTTTTSEEVGIVIEEKTPRYLVVCEHCGKEYKYWKKPRYTLDNYVCGNCKHDNFKLVENF